MFKKYFIYIIKFYCYFISCFLSPCCRFHPTCSSFAIQAIERHGVFGGLYYSIIRLLKCHPYVSHKYYDPVP